MVVQPGLCLKWSDTLKTGFLRTRLNYAFGARPLPKAYAFQRKFFAADVMSRRSVICVDHTVPGQASRRQFTSIKCQFFRLYIFFGGHKCDHLIISKYPSHLVYCNMSHVTRKPVFLNIRKQSRRSAARLPMQLISTFVFTS